MEEEKKLIFERRDALVVSFEGIFDFTVDSEDESEIINVALNLLQDIFVFLTPLLF